MAFTKAQRNALDSIFVFRAHVSVTALSLSRNFRKDLETKYQSRTSAANNGPKSHEFGLWGHLLIVLKSVGGEVTLNNPAKR
ncbi:MAG: hypothetical protein LBI10_12285 [Deltaproteobacteria bacterium]|jgi:hypothetical protein|nr:hypothetical protein [Deltaproteobacteria bacterium]